MVGEVAGVVDRFELTPQEDFVRGVRYADGVLSFGPSGTQVIQALLCGVAGLFGAALGAAGAVSGRMEVAGLPVTNRWAGAVFAAVSLLIGSAIAAGLLRRGVSANSSGLQIRRFWAWAEVPWETIADVVAVETAERKWVTTAGASGIRVGATPVGSWSLGLAVRGDGSAVELPSFVAAARDEGLSLGRATATELKVQALRRYREQVVGPWASSSVAIRSVDEPTRTIELILDLATPTALWLLACWSVGELVTPAWLLVAYVVIGYGWFRRRRRDPFRSIRR